ncbi:VWA domain-containing protein [Corallibacter vietnamensis]|uniref:VWA domain-containing protein n=1 Tax=Corallibacter vietnamensis TaxID=904130 RepID=A0ABP7HKB6_9FLAO
MKTIIQFVFLCTLVLQVKAQETLITGKVSDKNGLPLPGVNILVKGTTIGTQTNFNGFYSLNAKKGDTLAYSFVGYMPENRVVKTSNVINITMQLDDNSLEEVVITALGVKRYQKEVTASSNLIKKEYLNHSSNPNVVQGLSGKVSGLQINSKNKNSNQSTKIVLRGNRSIKGTNEALIVIDGKISNAETLANLSPKKIKETQVIKGAGGYALYGSQGAYGVIIVSTKNSGYEIPKELKESILKKSVQQSELETYDDIVENDFETVKQNPLSTFSIDVDRASYSNVRRMINNGEKINPNAVKIEEMINYFKYNYAQPKGNHPFSIHTEAAVTPWNSDTRIVKIGLQGKTYTNEQLPASNLTFLIDVSGSMNSQNKLPLLKSAFKLLVSQLREKDKVSIVVYAGAAGVVLEPTSGKDKETIMNAIDKLKSGGSTAGGEGIELAYKLAVENFIKDGNNRVIIATDGDFNVGASSDKAMEKLIEEKRKSGVFLSVLGFGYGNYKDSKLEILADKGNGNHAYIDNMQEAQKVFGKEFGGTLYTIAKDVKIQVEFNPKKVQAYRLIGYENRMLADEDFIDDTKDAGELGSGHTVTALYELIPVGVESSYLKEVNDLKYTTTNSVEGFSDELFTVKFRYKKPDGEKSIEMVHVQKDALSEGSEDLNFASAVALFGMQLRQSKYYNNASMDDVVALAKKGRGDDDDGFRAEFIRLVKASQNSIN